MASGTQGASGYYTWDAPGKSLLVHVQLDAIDRILADVMRGFAAVPKRGAEVGGVLIGSIEDGDRTIVRVEDFEAVECTYRRGPSYLFSGEDGVAFEETCRKLQPDDSRRLYAVGFYRSHTREGMALSPEDIDLMDEHFPSPSNVALLVKPFGTKVSIAGFFFRENGSFQDATPLEFPFRRRELTGEEAPARRPMIERRPREPRRMIPLPEPENGGGLFSNEALELDRVDTPSEPEPEPQFVHPRRSGMWIPLSFLFLLIGIGLGLMIAVARGGPGKSDPQDFSLGLSVTKVEDNLSVKWDRQSPAIRASDRGSLEIEDSGYTKVVDLDVATLQNGTITVQNPSHTVRFRLTVHPGIRVALTETLEWKQ